MKGRYQDHLAIVTGAAGGIGYAIAQALGRMGYEVALLDRQQDLLESAVQTLRDEGLQARGLLVDLADEADVASVPSRLGDAFGRVAVLVNNAGISPKHDGRSLTAENTPLDEWLSVINVNLTAPFLLCRAAAPLMRKQGWGRIVNMASLAGRTRSIVSGAHYSASKAGLIGFSRMFAGEVAKAGITVNCVAPGAIDAGLAQRLDPGLTDNYASRIPVGRIGRPEEVAALVAFIVSEQTAFITGATFDINGGYLMA